MRFLGMFPWKEYLVSSVIVVSVHVRELVSICPIGSGCVRHRLVVATSFFQKKAHVLLTNDANVKNHRRLQEIGEDVNVEKEIVLEP